MIMSCDANVKRSTATSIGKYCKLWALVSMVACVLGKKRAFILGGRGSHVPGSRLCWLFINLIFDCSSCKSSFFFFFFFALFSSAWTTVSRAHEIEIVSSVRLWHWLPLDLLPMQGFLSNFSCWLPWALGWDVFFFFFFKFTQKILFPIFTNISSFSSTDGTLWEQNKITMQLLQIAAESF